MSRSLYGPSVTSGRVARRGSREERLRIGMVAPPWFEVPPRGYGGIEAVVAGLVDQLAARDHEVVLVGAGRPHTRAAEFVPVFDPPPSGLLGTPLPEVVQAAAAAAAIDRSGVDVVHDHTLAGPLLARGRRVPTVTTMHGPVEGELGRYYELLGDTVGVIAISQAQRRANPRINWVATVPNAIDVASFPYQQRKEDYLLWLGRFSPDKGAHLAIDAALAAGRRIVLAGKRSEPAEQAYFAREIEPRLRAGVEYVGEADARRKRVLLAGARALVFPIQWDEPFGMVMIEAMACGTPVAALRRGSVPEVVVDQVTGLVADDLAGLTGALAGVDDLDPAAAREHAEQRFDLSVMAASHLRVYRRLVEGGPVASRDGAAVDADREAVA